MTITITIQYQEWNETTKRPDDCALNEDNLTVQSISDIPTVGDYVCLSVTDDAYKIRSRLFTYLSTNTISVNLVVEKANNFSELLKE